MSSNSYDVVIVGAGPAGVASAIRLNDLGFKVCLVDDVNDEKLKVGESIPGATIRLLNKLGIDSLDKLLSRELYAESPANVSSWAKDGWAYSHGILNPEGGGWHVLRHRFDASLRKFAIEGGTTYLKSKIGKIHKRGGKYEIGFKTNKENNPKRIFSNWLIDASGKAGMVVKNFGLKRIQFEEQLALVCWLKPESTDIDKTTRIKSVENGWWYTSKLPDSSRVVVFHGLPKDVSFYKKEFSVYLEDLQEIELLTYKVQGTNVKSGPVAIDASVSVAEKCFGDNWLAVGNAALSFDPLSSQGIFFALYSGILAAESISSIREGQDKDSVMNSYTLKVRKVHEQNRKARKYFYTQELRFLNHEYWSQYFQKSYT